MRTADDPVPPGGSLSQSPDLQSLNNSPIIPRTILPVTSSSAAAALRVLSGSVSELILNAPSAAGEDQVAATPAVDDNNAAVQASPYIKDSAGNKPIDPIQDENNSVRHACLLIELVYIYLYIPVVSVYT
jgi:hypothetical protein